MLRFLSAVLGAKIAVLFLKNSKYLLLSPVMGLVRSKWSGRTRLPLKSVKSVPPKQDIALFLHSSTMTLAPLTDDFF